jgi:hypothetical protein
MDKMAASPRKSDGSAIHPYPPFFQGRCRAIRSGSWNGFRKEQRSRVRSKNLRFSATGYWGRLEFFVLLHLSHGKSGGGAGFHAELGKNVFEMLANG